MSRKFHDHTSDSLLEEIQRGYNILVEAQASYNEERVNLIISKANTSNYSHLLLQLLPHPSFNPSILQYQQTPVAKCCSVCC